MHETGTVETLKPGLKLKVRRSTGESVMDCYQCGKCSAGCPLIDEMDIAPNQILRMLQLGFEEFEDRILRSKAIWLCLTCEQCFTRCPKEVDFPVIMDYLRQESVRQDKVNPGAKHILAFHKTFLDSVRMTGRLYEVGLIGGYKMRTMKLMQDVAMAPQMYFKGLLKMLPHRIHGKDVVARIFEKAKEEDIRLQTSDNRQKVNDGHQKEGNV
jgi:heterodisulfide reductase subunit C2